MYRYLFVATRLVCVARSTRRRYILDSVTTQLTVNHKPCSAICSSVGTITIIQNHDLTFRHLLEALDRDVTLPIVRRRHFACSVRRMSTALERRPEELPAKWSRVRSRVENVHPAALGWTERTAANHKSNLFGALTWYQQNCEISAGKTKRSPAWETLWSCVDDPYLKRRLSAFIKYLSDEGIGPEAVGEAAFDAFMRHRAESTRMAYRNAERRRVARAWNTCGETISAWPKQPLMISPDGHQKGPAYSDYPASLRAEIDRLFVGLARSRSLGARRSARSYAPSTVMTRRRELVAFMGKAVSIGFPITSLTSLRILLDPDLVRQVANGDGKLHRPGDP